MKKILAVILSLTLILSFTACSNTDVDNLQDDNNIGINDKNINIKDNNNNNNEKNNNIAEPKQNNSGVRSSGNVNDLLSWVFYNDGEIEISGWGEFPDSQNWQWVSFASYITKVTLKEGVMNVGDGAFKNCENLKSVYMADTVTAIGKEAFLSCTGLTDLVLPENLESIRSSAFEGCTGLTDLVLPENLEWIGSSAFEGCTSLAISNINLNDLASGCRVGSRAFAGCDSLTSFSFLEDYTSIYLSAFSDCKNLISVYIPKAVMSVGDLFENCDKLTDIYYGGSEAEWQSITIYDSGNYENNYTDVLFYTQVPDTVTVHYNSEMP